VLYLFVLLFINNNIRNKTQIWRKSETFNQQNCFDGKNVKSILFV